MTPELASSLDLLDLSLAANLHLFQWPGALVYGGEEGAIALDYPEVIQEKSLDEWRSPTHRAVEIGYLDRDKPGQPVPDQTPNEMWRQIFGGVTTARKEVGTNPLGFNELHPMVRQEEAISRPTPAAAFDAINQSIHIKENPWIRQLHLAELNFDMPPDPDPIAYFDGVTWAANKCAIATKIGGKIIARELAPSLTAAGARQLLTRHLSDFYQQEYIEAELQQFCDRTLNPLMSAHTRKIAVIQTEVGRWRDAGYRPVLLPSGEVDEALTLVNLAIACVGITKLWELHMAAWSFVQGAGDVFR